MLVDETTHVSCKCSLQRMHVYFDFRFVFCQIKVISLFIITTDLAYDPLHDMVTVD